MSNLTRRFGSSTLIAALVFTLQACTLSEERRQALVREVVTSALNTVFRFAATATHDAAPADDGEVQKPQRERDRASVSAAAPAEIPTAVASQNSVCPAKKAKATAVEIVTVQAERESIPGTELRQTPRELVDAAQQRITELKRAHLDRILAIRIAATVRCASENRAIALPDGTVSFGSPGVPPPSPAIPSLGVPLGIAQ